MHTLNEVFYLVPTTVLNCYDQYINYTNKYKYREVQWWAVNRTPILCLFCVWL